MAKVTNKFYIKAIHDGSSIYAELVSTTPQLTQRVRPDGSCVPNWNEGETGAVNPILYPNVKMGNTYKSPLIDSDPQSTEGFYYNGSRITWTTVNGKKVSSNFTVVIDGTTYYMFQLLESYSHDGITGPAIKIIHNLADGENSDNDIIRFDGHVEESGEPIVFSVGQVIRITTQSESGFSFTYGGRSFVNEEQQDNAIYVQLYEGMANEPSAISSYTVKWFQEGVGQITSSTRVGSTATAATINNVDIPAQSKYLKVSRADIDDNAVFRAEFYKTHNPPSAGDDPDITAFITIDDKDDKFEMFIVCDTAGAYAKKDVSIRSGQTVTMKAWMGDNNVEASEYADATGAHPFNSFKCRLTDDTNNATITSNASNPTIPPTGQSLDANGYFDITESNMSITSVKVSGNPLVVTKGGSITIGFDFVDANGGGVTGYVLAEAVTVVGD